MNNNLYIHTLNSEGIIDVEVWQNVEVSDGKTFITRKDSDKQNTNQFGNIKRTKDLDKLTTTYYSKTNEKREYERKLLKVEYMSLDKKTLPTSVIREMSDLFIKEITEDYMYHDKKMGILKNQLQNFKKYYNDTTIHH